MRSSASATTRVWCALGPVAVFAFAAFQASSKLISSLPPLGVFSLLMAGISCRACMKGHEGMRPLSFERARMSHLGALAGDVEVVQVVLEDRGISGLLWRFVSLGLLGLRLVRRQRRILRFLV